MRRNTTIVFCHLIVNKNMASDDTLKLLKDKRSEITKNAVHYTTVQNITKLNDIGYSHQEHYKCFDKFLKSKTIQIMILECISVFSTYIKKT